MCERERERERKVGVVFVTDIGWLHFSLPCRIVDLKLWKIYCIPPLSDSDLREILNTWKLLGTVFSCDCPAPFPIAVLALELLRRFYIRRSGKWDGFYAQLPLRQALGPGALGRPGGSGWRGRWEWGSGWGRHVNSRPFHFNV